MSQRISAPKRYWAEVSETDPTDGCTISASACGPHWMFWSGAWRHLADAEMSQICWTDDSEGTSQEICQAFAAKRWPKEKA